MTSGPPRPSSLHNDLFAPEAQRTGNKSQIQEIKDEGEGKSNKGDGVRVLVPEDRGLPEDRNETDAANRTVVV